MLTFPGDKVKDRPELAAGVPSAPPLEDNGAAVAGDAELMHAFDRGIQSALVIGAYDDVRCVIDGTNDHHDGKAVVVELPVPPYQFSALDERRGRRSLSIGASPTAGKAILSWEGSSAHTTARKQPSYERGSLARYRAYRTGMKGHAYDLRCFSGVRLDRGRENISSAQWMF